MKRKVYAPQLAAIRSYPEQIFIDSLYSIIDNMREDFESFLKRNPGISNKFKKHENTNFNFITANQKSVFVNNYSSNHPDGSRISSSFNNYLKTLKYNDGSLLPSPRFRDFLRNIRYNETFALIGRKPELASPSTDHIKAMFFIIDSLFTDPVIRNYSLYTTLKFELRQLGLAIPPEIIDDFYTKCTNERYKAEIKENYLIWTKLRKGAEAPSFNGIDYTGKKISLSDFKGKYVFIDVWATWCGPCLKEMPAMNSLASEYKGSADIVFIKISIDANKQLWENKIAKEESSILSLWAENGANSDFAKAYAIKDIPRYILIDKQGKIVDSQTLAPSQMKDRLDAVVK
jgi:thiol-disulfide isomerase/thioredoxin